MNMKKVLLSLFYLQLFFAEKIWAQSPSTYYTTPIDYIRTYAPVKPVTDATQVNMTAVPEDIVIATQYKDSYGRPLQNVTKKASPLKKDIVELMYYDGFGNASSQFMPFAE